MRESIFSAKISWWFHDFSQTIRLRDLYPSAQRGACDRGAANATLFSAPGIPGSPFLLGEKSRRAASWNSCARIPREFIRGEEPPPLLDTQAAMLRHKIWDMFLRDINFNFP